MKHSTRPNLTPDLVCLSHLRWNFVFQRPQHLMSRFAKNRRVFFVEEPIYSADSELRIDARICSRTGVEIVIPYIPEQLRSNTLALVDRMLSDFAVKKHIEKPLVWFYTPMAMDWLPSSITPSAVVYDCMDELTGFQGAPTQLSAYEQRLLGKADLVFTGGVSLFEAKRRLHPRVHPFPSGVDVSHFVQARSIDDEPADQKDISHPRLGFAGVIDERMDLELIRQVAERRPTWQLIMLGPIVKIDPASVPRLPNIHWLGMKDYQDLPRYFSGWDVGIMPFAMNDATRFISPTKTPEYLAAGLPVVSTPIRDVVRPYGELGLAHIAHTPEEFVTHAEQAMAFGMSLKWRERADEFLQSLSWDATWSSMNRLIEEALQTVTSTTESRHTTENVGTEAAHV